MQNLRYGESTVARGFLDTTYVASSVFSGDRGKYIYFLHDYLFSKFLQFILLYTTFPII